MIHTLGILRVATIVSKTYSEVYRLWNRFFWLSFYKYYTHIPHKYTIYDLILPNAFPLVVMQSAITHTVNFPRIVKDSFFY